jgi:Phage integrase family
MDATPRDRVATPAEFAELLAALKPEDALPVGAGWLRHRSQAGDPGARLAARRPEAGRARAGRRRGGRKPGGSWRVVPLVRPLRRRLREAWIAQGRPSEGKVCPPRQRSASGMLQLGGLQRRVHRAWRDRGLEPIGLHEARHTAATWLDHAGVSPKVASTLMGHKTPEYQPGAASIKLRRYTHTGPAARSSPPAPGRAAAAGEPDHDRARRPGHPPGLRRQPLRPAVLSVPARRSARDRSASSAARPSREMWRAASWVIAQRLWLTTSTLCPSGSRTNAL